MLNDKNSHSKWIVKSENKILGPYSFDQIEDLIRKKQISIIDEVRDSETRWLYVRENPEFKSIVDSIRQELDSKQEATRTVQTVSKTEEISKTKAEIPFFPEETSDEKERPKDIAIVREIVETQKKDLNQFYRDEFSKKDKVKLYGLENDQKIKNKVDQSTNRFLILISGFFLFLIVSTVGFYFFQKQSQLRQEDQWIQQVKKYKVLSLDEKAIEVYGRINNENKRKVLPFVIELIPSLEAAGLVQIRDVENLKDMKELSIEQKAHLQLVFFWSAMSAQNFNSAQDYLTRASAILPTSPLVNENEALMNLRRGVFQKSYAQFNELMKTESSGRYLVGMALAFSGLPAAEQSQNLLDLSQKIEKYSLIFYDYRKELLLIQMYLAQQEKNAAFFERSWTKFTQTPNQMAKLFKKPNLLVPNSYNWKELENLAKAVRANLSEENQAIFDIHNLLELDQISAASQFLNANSAKIKDVAIRQQMNLLIFHYQNRRSDILALEKTNQLNMKSELNHVLLALNKIEDSPQADVDVHSTFFTTERLEFYSDWISLIKIRKLQNNEALRAFTRSHFQTINNFIPLLEAKSVIE